MGGRKEKSKAKARDHESIDNLDRASTPSLVFSASDDDDEEANQDLSLKIVEKALRTRESKLTSNDAVLPPQQPEILMPQRDDVSIEPNQSVCVGLFMFIFWKEWFFFSFFMIYVKLDFSVFNSVLIDWNTHANYPFWYQSDYDLIWSWNKCLFKKIAL